MSIHPRYARCLHAAGLLLGLAAGLLCAACAREESGGLESPRGDGPSAKAAQALSSSQACMDLRRGGAGGARDAQIVSSLSTKNFGSSQDMSAGTISGSKRQILLGFDPSPIPAGPATQIDSAALSLSASSFTAGATLDLHAAGAPWSEGTVTWKSFNGAYAPAVLASAPVSSPGLVIPLPPAVVRAWIDDPTHNYGLLLDQVGAQGISVFSSSESAATAAVRPTLRVCFHLTCAPGMGDCNQNPFDGCETDLGTSLASCGACGAACALPHEAASCQGGACVPGACAEGYLDCDGDPLDGCEPAPCAPGSHCAAGQDCRSGFCQGGVCTPLLAPIPPTHLAGYWPLRGDFADATGAHALTALRPGGFTASAVTGGEGDLEYGPTAQASDNGAVGASFTSLDGSQGLTLEGWFVLPDNDGSAVLFGFSGGETWGQPKLFVGAEWGYVTVRGGSTEDSVSVRYGRFGDHCWHHAALVLPPGYNAGAPFHLYVDGEEQAPSLIDRSPTGTAAFTGAQLFGEPFVIGRFSGFAGGYMRVDEVRAWERALAPDEVRELATASGTGDRCVEPPPPAWAPGPLCAFPSPLPAPEPEIGVRFLSDDTLSVVVDPTAWLTSRILADCGAYLAAMEQHRAEVDEGRYQAAYATAALWTLQTYRAPLLAALEQLGTFELQGPGGAPIAPSSQHVWPQATRELRVPKLGGSGQEADEIIVPQAEEIFFSYLKLPVHLAPGQPYALHHPWGAPSPVVFDPASSISWALKVDQVGYLPQAGRKYGYLGAWLGPGGALDLASVSGAPFTLRRESDGLTVFTGVIAPRMADQTYAGAPLVGESVYELDFSSFSTPGRYYLRVEGIGRSFGFPVAQDGLGEAFYTHARGLYHQRCAPLDPARTAWHRGDIHAVFRGGFPPEQDDYADHSAEGWGFRDAAGAYAAYDTPTMVAITATSEPLPQIVGGWHDAADFDRGSTHAEVVRDLVTSYLMFPASFSDGQLDLPESGNGVPDILDEAAWGIDHWRRGQEADGRVATWIEATSHPKIFDPGLDTQPYYRSLATRRSSLLYAAHAALLGRALAQAGDSARAALFVQSARDAYAFGVRTDLRVVTSFVDPASGALRTWSEPAAVDATRRLYAAIELWLATGDQAFRAALDLPEVAAAFQQQLASCYWQPLAFPMTSVALGPQGFPAGWSDAARAAIVAQGDFWRAKIEENPYRKAWYAPGDGYFPLMSWGANGFNHLRWLVAAHRLTGDPLYRDAALLGVDWMHGANPQGRVYTTGLGHNTMASVLHLPSFVDGRAEPVPGITVFNITGGIPFEARTEVYGLFGAPDLGFGYPGAALAGLPAPWQSPGLTSAQVGAELYNILPLYRRFVLLENQNVPQTEFGVTLQGNAAAVTGCLMGPGWTPGAALLGRQPRSRAELRDAIWYEP
ncbi:MAG: glycoside hydrolase family 9 protein [Byssovorax sp.]